MSDEQYLVQTPKCSVKLIRNSRGYNWEITYRDDYQGVVLQKVEEIDKELREKYGSTDS
ncbi:MAG: hypothetical protein M5U09_12615 [Gammaproteobacteria bacterium]|nr:hypothetical protein [Gammaproteobacteria bacterium]